MMYLNNVQSDKDVIDKLSDLSYRKVGVGIRIHGSSGMKNFAMLTFLDPDRYNWKTSTKL